MEDKIRVSIEQIKLTSDILMCNHTHIQLSIEPDLVNYLPSHVYCNANVVERIGQSKLRLLSPKALVLLQLHDLVGQHLYTIVFYTYIDHTLANSLHRLLNCKIGVSDSCVITTEYRTRDHCIHMYHLLCNALVHVIYSGVSSQCSLTLHVL